MTYAIFSRSRRVPRVFTLRANVIPQRYIDAHKRKEKRARANKLCACGHPKMIGALSCVPCDLLDYEQINEDEWYFLQHFGECEPYEVH